MLGSVRVRREHPGGAEARPISIAFSALLKSYPDTKPLTLAVRASISAGCKVTP